MSCNECLIREAEIAELKISLADVMDCRAKMADEIIDYKRRLGEVTAALAEIYCKLNQAELLKEIGGRDDTPVL